MGGRMSIILNAAVALSALISSAAAQQDAIATTSTSPRWSETEINLLVPDEIKPSGEHGTVVLEGNISAESRVADLVVAKTSGSEMIDHFARDRFSNKRLGADMLVGAPTRVRLVVKIYNTEGLDFGKNFSCAQAVLDADWFTHAFPGRGIEHTPLYLLIESSGSMLGIKELGFARDHANYDRVWVRTIEACRAAPASPFMATMISAAKK